MQKIKHNAGILASVAIDVTINITSFDVTNLGIASLPTAPRYFFLVWCHLAIVQIYKVLQYLSPLWMVAVSMSIIFNFFEIKGCQGTGSSRRFWIDPNDVH